MANFELKFIDMSYVNDYVRVKKETYYEEKDYVLITFKTASSEDEQEIMLDKSTAIKFAKTLRTEINKITEKEAKDGNI